MPTNYEKIYGDIEKAADRIAYNMLLGAMDNSPVPPRDMDTSGDKYILDQIKLVSMVLPELQKFSRWFLEEEV